MDNESLSELEDDSVQESKDNNTPNLAGRIRPKKSKRLRGIVSEKAQKQKWD